MLRERQISHRFCVSKPRVAAVRGFAVRPTNRSEIVKDRSNSLDGAWREDSFWRAMRITVLPRVVVTDKTINVDYYERYQFISSSSIGEFW